MRERIMRGVAAMVLVWGLMSATTSSSALGRRQEPPREEEPSTQPTIPTTQPVLVLASDKAAIQAAMGKDVFLEGVVESAAWSQSGKVMRVEFKDAAESKVHVVLFEKKRSQFDAGFGGDVAKALNGKHVRIKGQLKDYKGRPEIVLDLLSQITILDELGT